MQITEYYGVLPIDDPAIDSACSGVNPMTANIEFQ